MHFDSVKNQLSANAQHPFPGRYPEQPDSLCLSPGPKELTAFVHPFSPAALGNLMPSKVGNAEKAAKTGALEHSQKVRWVSFLRITVWASTSLRLPQKFKKKRRRFFKSRLWILFIWRLLFSRNTCRFTFEIHKCFHCSLLKVTVNNTTLCFREMSFMIVN